MMDQKRNRFKKDSIYFYYFMHQKQTKQNQYVSGSLINLRENIKKALPQGLTDI